MSSALEVLMKYGEEMGLEAERIPPILLNGLMEEETLVTFAIGSGGRQAPEVARAWLTDSPDPSYIKYECRDDGGAPQGIGIIKVEKRESLEKGLFSGQREGVSDVKYAWYVSHYFPHGTCFHVCDCPPSRCPVKLREGDPRGLIYTGAWRRASPLRLCSQKFAQPLGVRWEKSLLDSAGSGDSLNGDGCHCKQKLARPVAVR